MNVLITPPESHFDRGLGISAWHFRDAATLLLVSEDSRNLLSPISYLQRHSIELFLKSLIYILHRKFNIEFGGEFNLENPAILVSGKWKPFSNTHNLSDLYKYFRSVFDENFELLTKTTDWIVSDDLEKKINLVSGYDPKSTYFRYPKASSKSQDEKKSTVQPMDLVSAIAGLGDSNSIPIKCAVVLDADDNVVATYDLVPQPLEDVREALCEIMEYLHSMHCAFLGELTKWS